MGQVTGGDWIVLASQQATACRAAHGVQSAVGFATVPFTPGDFALNQFQFWTGAMSTVFLAAAREGKAIPPGVLVDADDVLGSFTALPAESLFLSPLPAQVAGSTDDAGVRQSAQRIDTAQRVMLDAMSQGSNPGTHNAEGFLCLDSVNSARFWEQVAAMGREFSFLAAQTSISTSESLQAVAEGAKDGLRAVGQAAGTALAAAGEGVGTTVSGFFKGLGVIDTALLLGGGYVVARVVF